MPTVISKLIKKGIILKDAIIGNLLKIRVWFDIRVKRRISLSDKQDESLIISLTSYGYRLRNSVAYTIYSLLKQEVRAKKIILWLGENERENGKQLPKSLLFMQKYGVEIRFCEDIKSYKKLIPTLRNHRNCTIMTVDDDIYYSRIMTKVFLNVHHAHPKYIVAGIALMPKTASTGRFAPYNEWTRNVRPEDICTEKDERLLFAVGVGAVLYPANAFDDEVLDKSLFTRLCPQADDLWFYIMGLRMNARKTAIPTSEVKYYPVDLFHQVLKRDRLQDANVIHSKNDVQLDNLMKHYNISL